MPPDQPTQTPAPAGHYDFIMQPQQTQPAGAFMPGSKGRMAIIIGVGAGVLIAIVIGASLIFGGKESASADIITAVAQEQELARISSLATTKATDPTTRALAATANAVLSSDSASLKAYLKKSGTKVTAKQLVSTSSKTNDAALSAGAQENHYDEAYLSLMTAKLKPYQSLLSSAYKVSGPKGKVFLKTAYGNAQLLSGSQALGAVTQTDL